MLRVKSVLVAAFIMFATLTLHSVPAFATLTTWNFAGTMDDNGDAFTGHITFRDDLGGQQISTDLDPTTVIRYLAKVIPDLSNGEMLIDIGGDLIFASDVESTGGIPDWVGEVDVMNDVDAKGDLIRFTVTVLSPTIANAHGVDLFFIDETGALLTTDPNGSTLTSPPDLSSLILDPSINGWGDHFSLTSAAVLRLTNSQGQAFRFGSITSLSGPSIPEPSTIAILGIGLAGLAAVRRRRKAA